MTAPEDFGSLGPLMKCPRCVQSVSSGREQCGRCGFQLSCLDEEFGRDVVLLDRLTDAAHCLRVRERDALSQLLDDFEEEFPQLFAAVYFGALPELTSIRQFGFWLINHAAIPSLDISKPNEQGVLIVVDLQSRVIGVTLGYMLERYVSAKDLERCLRAARTHLFAGDFHRGVTVFVRKLSHVLRKVARRARRHPEQYAPQVRPDVSPPHFTKLKEDRPEPVPESAEAMPVPDGSETSEEDMINRVLAQIESEFNERMKGKGGSDDS